MSQKFRDFFFKQFAICKNNSPLNVQTIFNCLISLNPKLFPCFKHKLITAPYFLNWVDSHITVKVTREAEVHSNWFHSVHLTRLASTTYVLTKSDLHLPVCHTHILWTMGTALSSVLDTGHTVDHAGGGAGDGGRDRPALSCVVAVVGGSIH